MDKSWLFFSLSRSLNAAIVEIEFNVTDCADVDLVLIFKKFVPILF